IGLFKTEVTHRRSWRSREEVEGRPSVGSTGITIADCWGRSATYPRQKRRRRTTLATRVTPSRRDSNEMASGEAGAIQSFPQEVSRAADRWGGFAGRRRGYRTGFSPE